MSRLSTKGILYVHTLETPGMNSKQILDYYTEPKGKCKKNVLNREASSPSEYTALEHLNILL